MSFHPAFHRLRLCLLALVRDESGETSIVSLVLICTIIAIGTTVGLVKFRDQVTQELGDVSVAIESLDQSFDAGPYGSFADTVPPAPVEHDPPDSISFVP